MDSSGPNFLPEAHGPLIVSNADLRQVGEGAKVSGPVGLHDELFLALNMMQGDWIEV